MVFFCTALHSRPLACRATAVQQAGRLSHRVSSAGSAYLGQSLRPQLAKGESEGFGGMAATCIN